MSTITCPTTELAVGQTIVEYGPRGTTKRTEVTSVQWSRRAEYCIVNRSMVYSYGGTYELETSEVFVEIVPNMQVITDAFNEMGRKARQTAEQMAASFAVLDTSAKFGFKPASILAATATTKENHS